jgi:Peptidase inhibitor I78 family
MRAALIALALAGCVTAPPEPSGPCRADGPAGLVGQAGTPDLGAEALRRSGALRLRWIRPGDMVTMDYSPQRLNIHLDAQGRVDHFACG